MILPGFTSPNSTTLRRAVPFHDDMEMLLGKWSAAGEPVLWFGSVLSGIVFCKLVRFCPDYKHIILLFDYHFNRFIPFTFKVLHLYLCGSLIFHGLASSYVALQSTHPSQPFGLDLVLRDIFMVYDISKALSPVTFPGYNKLTKTEKMEWNNRAFSTAHALLSSAVAFYLLYISDIFRDSAPYGPVVFRSSILSQFGLGFSCGYFIADMGMIIAFYPILGGYEFLLHHLVSMLSLLLAVHSGHAHLYLYIVLLSECTTPFINLRWYLTVLGLKSSDMYMYNGAFTAFLWLVARVVNFVYLFYHLYLHFDQVKQLHTVGFWLLLFAPTSLGLMNSFWFYKIVNGVLRTLNRKHAP